MFGRLLERLDGRVTLVAGGAKGELLHGLGVVAAAMDFDALPMHECFTDTPLAQCELPGLLGRCERLISCFAAGNRTAELRLAALCAAGNAAFLPVRPPEGSQGHLFDLWADMLGLDSGREHTRPWKVPLSWRQAANKSLADAGLDTRRKYSVIHPGAGAIEKCWTAERFAELALKSDLRGEVVFVLGPVELDRWNPQRVERLGREFPTLVQPSLPVLAGVLAGTEAFVGNDCGVSHLAAAVGAPTVVLFGPTRPEQFAPLGEAVATVAARRMEDISVDQVAASIGELDERRGR